MIDEHYKAVKALIRPGITVYLYEVDTTPSYPYVLIWGSPGNRTTETLTDTPRDYETSIKLTYVGVNGTSVFGLMADVRADLDRNRPTVPGWACQRLEVTALADLAPDENVTIQNYGHPLRAVDEVLVQSALIT